MQASADGPWGRQKRAGDTKWRDPKSRSIDKLAPCGCLSFRIIGMQCEGPRSLAFRSAEPLFLNECAEIIQQLAFFLALNRYLKIV